MESTILINDYKVTKECTYKNEHYSVRDNGSILRHAQNPSKPRPLDEKWTFGRKSKSNGYMYIGSHRVHIIVATAFHGIHDSTKDIVDHIDTNRCNNRVENLRWLTRLENALINPVTRKKIEYLCDGDIQKFIDNPSCLKDLAGEFPNLQWMRTVSKDEAKAAYERVMKWAEEDNRTKPTGKGIGEWIYQTPTEKGNKQNINNDWEYIDAPDGYNNKYELYLETIRPRKAKTETRTEEIYKHTDSITESLSENALQKNWRTPTEFPLCPSVIKDKQVPLNDYKNKLKKGLVINKNMYATYFIDDFAICNDNLLVVQAHTKDGMKKYSTIHISFENGKYIHEGHTFFEEKGARKDLILSQGKEWDGGDCIDDYC